MSLSLKNVVRRMILSYLCTIKQMHKILDI